MAMLYKIKQGYAEENHYGLALAKVIGLPQDVLEVAEEVTTKLEAQLVAKKQSSKAAAVVKKRKLVLSLKESLEQAYESPLQGMALTNWLRRLQSEFVLRMDQIDSEIATSNQHNEGSVNEGQSAADNEESSQVREV